MLECIIVTNCPTLCSLAGLEQAPRLLRLDLRGVAAVATTAPLAGCQRLEVVIIVLGRKHANAIPPSLCGLEGNHFLKMVHVGGFLDKTEITRMMMGDIGGGVGNDDCEDDDGCPLRPLRYSPQLAELYFYKTRSLRTLAPLFSTSASASTGITPEPLSHHHPGPDGPDPVVPDPGGGHGGAPPATATERDPLPPPSPSLLSSTPPPSTSPFLFAHIKVIEIKYTPVASLEPLRGRCLQLKKLNVSGCGRLQHLGGLEDKASLLSVIVNYCRALTSVAALATNTALCVFLAEDCTGLVALDGLQGKRRLQTVNLSGNPTIEALAPYAASWRSLVELNVRGCPRLASLDGLEAARRLRDVKADGCPRIASLAPLRTCCRLESFCNSGNTALTTLDGLQGKPASLCEVRLQGATRLVSVAALADAARLAVLDISGATALRSIAGLEDKPHLSVLDLRRCFRLRSLSPLRKTPNVGGERSGDDAEGPVHCLLDVRECALLCPAVFAADHQVDYCSTGMSRVGKRRDEKDVSDNHNPNNKSGSSTDSDADPYRIIATCGLGAARASSFSLRGRAYEDGPEGDHTVDIPLLKQLQYNTRFYRTIERETRSGFSSGGTNKSNASGGAFGGFGGGRGFGGFTSSFSTASSRPAATTTADNDAMNRADDGGGGGGGGGGSSAAHATATTTTTTTEGGGTAAVAESAAAAAVRRVEKNIDVYMSVLVNNTHELHSSSSSDDEDDDDTNDNGDATVGGGGGGGGRSRNSTTHTYAGFGGARRTTGTTAAAAVPAAAAAATAASLTTTPSTSATTTTPSTTTTATTTTTPLFTFSFAPQSTNGTTSSTAATAIGAINASSSSPSTALPPPTHTETSTNTGNIAGPTGSWRGDPTTTTTAHAPPKFSFSF